MKMGRGRKEAAPCQHRETLTVRAICEEATSTFRTKAGAAGETTVLNPIEIPRRQPVRRIASDRTGGLEPHSISVERELVKVEREGFCLALSAVACSPVRCRFIHRLVDMTRATRLEAAGDKQDQWFCR